MRHLTVGILAHVDAGKTTLSEAMLYCAGKLRRLGRVDHGNTYLDSAPMERERGITIFSKQARLTVGETEFVLLDTPGHVDFSAEAERTLQVLDYAILVISGTDGVQNHTRTLWELLRRYEVPTFIFINKMDLSVTPAEVLAAELQEKLDPACTPFFPHESAAALDERLAMADEALLELYLETGILDREAVAGLIAERRLFPCLFGAAIRPEGVEELLSTLNELTLSPLWPDTFGARVYKIAYDGGAANGGAGTRLTYLKVTGGALSVRDEITYLAPDGRTRITEKAAQLRLYSGEKFTQVDQVTAGEICAVVGLSATAAGQGLGSEGNAELPMIEPVLSYRICLPPGQDPALCYPRLRVLEEEDPALRLRLDPESGEITAALMGEVQIEVLQRLALDRLGLEIGVDMGRILYRETISAPVVGMGHFEPLRHYAEVHLLLEPMPAGSGITVDTRCPEDSLARSWQRMILSMLEGRVHRGVLTGAPLTDVKITLLAGRAHLKHTDGGDFREAAGRAVRQGLMQAKSVLLEPVYRYRMTVPADAVGRAMHDLQMRGATIAAEASTETETTLVGRVPVATMRNYLREMQSYTHGQGRLWCGADGYAPCHNAEEVIAAAAYNPEADLAQPPHSVFCAHGAGFTVPWDKVGEHMHLEVEFDPAKGTDEPILPSPRAVAKRWQLNDEELEAIMLRTFGPVKRRRYTPPRTVGAAKAPRELPPRREQLLVDGYNVIFAWEHLRDLAGENLDAAREALMDILDNYVAYTKADLTLVFDAYNRTEGTGHEEERNGYRIVYTAAHETADTYLERMMHRRDHGVTTRVVTSDRLIQLSAVHAGILRLSAREFEEEILSINREITDFLRRLTAEEK